MLCRGAVDATIGMCWLVRSPVGAARKPPSGHDRI